MLLGAARELLIQDQMKRLGRRRREGEERDVVLGFGTGEGLLDEVLRGQAELFEVEELSDGGRGVFGGFE
jgi:hypothetical protein